MVVDGVVGAKDAGEGVVGAGVAGVGVEGAITWVDVVVGDRIAGANEMK